MLSTIRSPLPSRRALLAGAAFLSLFSPGPLSASTVERLGLRELVSRAELIAETEVLAVEHRVSSRVEPGDEEVPHTFVTYSISRLVKGSSSAGERLTLRFRGGPDGRGRVLTVPGTPRFHVGDRDVLFVARNGASICPLVGFEQGRLRRVRGGVVDALGYDLWFSPRGEMSRGERRVDVRREGAPPVVTPRGGASARADERPRSSPPAGALAPDEDGLITLLRALVREAEIASAEPAPTVAPTPSLDASAPFRVSRRLPAARRRNVRRRRGE
ncbi:MAG: hypothetical protein ACF8XB_06325, partial [Planctomycetota bacterium JB042]